MTPQLQAAIAAIQSLSHTERQQLLQILTPSDPTSVGDRPLKTLPANEQEANRHRRISPSNHLLESKQVAGKNIVNINLFIKDEIAHTRR
ncbi:MAG: hypothetical protein HC899_29090 [Leptolyngbyaceae cyanobacterium SM1_4_3]|nr:hypothetical protein [Leptolyngbyaceae cyanobacterium SM1_4_3]NJN90322.1 hypothetical protein [Leptolyngbyaceae cyanobacterium SL_5_14]